MSLIFFKIYVLNFVLKFGNPNPEMAKVTLLSPMYLSSSCIKMKGKERERERERETQKKHPGLALMACLDEKFGITTFSYFKKKI